MPNLRKAAPHAASKILRGMRSCGNVLIQVRTTAASNVHHSRAALRSWAASCALRIQTKKWGRCLRSLRELVASPRRPLIEGTCCKTPTIFGSNTIW